MRISRTLRLGMLWAALAAGCDGNVNDGSSGLVVTSRVSVAPGVEAIAPSSAPSISADGRYVAFESRAPNLHPDDTDVLSDIFVHDRHTGVVHLASRADGPSGAKGTAASARPSISADGRYVAFETLAGNLHTDDRDAIRAIYVRDLVDGVTYFVSRDSGTPGGPDGAKFTDDSFAPSISADGRYVAFHIDDGFGLLRAYRRDVFDRITERFSGTINVGLRAWDASISGDGSVVALTTDEDLDPDDSGFDDVYAWHVAAGTFTLVSRPSGISGTKGDGPSGRPRISLNGKYVAFESDAANLLPFGNDANGVTDVFLRDLADHTTVRVSVASSGVESTEACREPSISADGRFVAFVSAASNLVNDDLNGRDDVFIRDTRHGGDIGPRLTVRASVRTYGAETSDHSGAPAMAGNGRFVAFDSHSTNMVEGDQNGARDVFVRGVFPWQDAVWDEPALESAGFAQIVKDPDAAADDEATAISLRSAFLIAAGFETVAAGNTAWRLQKAFHQAGSDAGFNFGDPFHVLDIGAGDDRPTAVVMGPNDVYTVGYSTSAGSGKEWTVLQLDWFTAFGFWGPGTDGLIVESYSAGDDVARGTAVDDDQLYVVGSDSAPGSLQWRMEARELSVDGSKQWEVTENPGAGDDEALAVAIDSRHAYVVGYDSLPGDVRWRIEKRLLSDGSLVAGFGTGGVVALNPSAGDDRATAVARTETHLFVGGFDESQGSGNRRWVVVKLRLDDGTPAAGFGTAGVIGSDPTTGDDEIRGIAVDGSGLYLVGTEAGGDGWRLERRRPGDGSPLPSVFFPATLSVDPTPGTIEPLRGLASDGTFLYLAGAKSRGGSPLEWIVEKRKK